jgi:hypothetical protein
MSRHERDFKELAGKLLAASEEDLKKLLERGEFCGGAVP